MALGILGSIFGFIAKPLDTVLKKVLPNKEQRDLFKHDLEMEMLRLPMKEKELFEKRVVAEYEHPNWLRDSVRPVITYCAWAFYMTAKIVTIWTLSRVYVPMLNKMTAGEVDAIYQNIDKIKALLFEYVSSIFTTADLYIMLTILGFWFGSKLLERVIDKVAKTGGVAGVIMGLKKGMGKYIPQLQDDDTYEGDV